MCNNNISNHKMMSAMLLTLFVCCLSRPCAAGSGAGAIAMAFAPQSRCVGMGEAAGSVFWGDAPEYWANPALLGYQRGLRFDRTDYQLAVGMADDISFQAERLSFGRDGLGIAMVGKPISGLGNHYLDMGRQIAMNEEGVAIGEYNAYMKYSYLGLGLSVAEFSKKLAPTSLLGEVFRYGDVSLGYSRKDYEDQLAHNPLMQDSGASAEQSSQDLGMLARLTPYNSIDYPDYILDRGAGIEKALGGLRIDLAYGYSILNFDDKMIHHVDTDQADPMPKEHRRSYAIHIATGLPDFVRESLESAGLGILADSMTPLISWSRVWDRMVPGYKYDLAAEQWTFEQDMSQVEYGSGWELTIANVLSIRRGHHEAEYGDVDGDTSGTGIGFHVGRFGGFRYDKATRPQASALPELELTSWTMFLDVLAIVDAAK